jgi:hypothetical protein
MPVSQVRDADAFFSFLPFIVPVMCEVVLCEVLYDRVQF